MPFSVQPPAPNMRINLEVTEAPQAAWWTGMNGRGTPASNAGNKQQALGIFGWVRLDFGLQTGETRERRPLRCLHRNPREQHHLDLRRHSEPSRVTSTAATGLAGASVTSGFAQKRVRRFR